MGSLPTYVSLKFSDHDKKKELFPLKNIFKEQLWRMRILDLIFLFN